MKLIVVWMLLFGFSVVEARGVRSITERLPQIAKRIGIDKIVGVTALGTVLLCSPSCEHGERLVGEQFTRSGTPATTISNTKRTYHGENLAYSLASIIGNQKTGTTRETHHTGIYVKLGVWSDALSITLERERDSEILSKRFSLNYAGAASSGSFDIYDSANNDIGDGYFYTNGRTSYSFEAGNGVEVELLLNEGNDGGATIQLLRFFASKEVLDGQNLHGQPVYRNETFSWLELPANHFLRIGNAQLERDAAELAEQGN